jgi:GTP:adenosylcobinamide-phosphate guanylyltransferase
MPVNAMVLAGGDGAVIDTEVHIKGLVPIAGRPMIEWVIDALESSASIDAIAVVVPSRHDLGPWADRVRIVVSNGSFIDNALAGFDALGGDGVVLAATGDIPALTPDAIDDFVARSIASGAEFTYPLVSAADMDEQFPGSARTYVKVDGERVTGGNMMVVSPDVVRRNRDLGQRLFDTRKSPLAMARVIGIPFIVRYVLGTLRVTDVEAKMRDLLGAPCAAIRTSHASIGADVDKPLDVVVTQRVLSRRDFG